ncbi:MAG TPA: glycosyltransferase [Opitutaceae bacterium]|nr:glycosyltransferase [Opitutaceae bacterium]
MLTTILCTHNPRPDYLGRTLAGLRAQTLAPPAWELLLVDNASAPPVTGMADLGWHPSARLVRENELGLTPARLRGIAEARGSVLVFVDDDNVLAPDYLERAVSLAERWPALGVWGCGRYTAEWEQPPPPEFAPYLAYLAVGSAPADRRSARAYDYTAMPAGAGLCVRAEIARGYADDVRGDPRRKLLGRAGARLNGCEDFDLALTAIDRGHEAGVFRDLAITHLMPRGRGEETYLLRLVEGHARSTVLLMVLRGDQPAPAPRGLLGRLREYRLRRSLGPIERKIHDARRRGEQAAWEAVRQMSLAAP